MAGCGCKFELSEDGGKITHCKLHGSAQYLLDELVEIQRSLMLKPTSGIHDKRDLTPADAVMGIGRLLGHLKLPR